MPPSSITSEAALSVALLHLDNLVLQLVERKLAPNDFKHVVQIAAVEQHDTGGIIGGFLLAQRDVPAQNNPVRLQAFECGIVSQHFPLDDLAASGFGRLLVLS